MISFPAFSLVQFVTESNRIEGMGPAQMHEIRAHETLLSTEPALTVNDICTFVTEIGGKPLRELPGMQVYVGNHVPPPGGPDLVRAFSDLLYQISENRAYHRFRGLTPFEAHVRYETLHPFMDGNGRSGRAVWLWQMGGIQRAPLGFLHHFYYQTLDASR